MSGKQDKKVVTKSMLLSADCEEFSERRTLFLFIFVAVINGLIFMAVETNRIEYKQCLTEDLEKEAVAFLNYREGGVLYIGVNKAGVPVGVKDLDGDMLKIKDRLKNNIQPSCMGLFDVAEEKMGEVEVIKVTFASGMEKPYYIRRYGMTERGAFIRVGTAAEPMPEKMIAALYAKSIRRSIGTIKSPNQQFAANYEFMVDGEFHYAAY